jgi:hypothetical protein
LTSSSRHVRSLPRKTLADPALGAECAVLENYAEMPNRRAHARFTWPPLICAVTVRGFALSHRGDPRPRLLNSARMEVKMPAYYIGEHIVSDVALFDDFLAKVVP